MSTSRQASPSNISLLVDVETVLSCRQAVDRALDVDLPLSQLGEGHVTQDVTGGAGYAGYGAKWRRLL